MSMSVLRTSAAITTHNGEKYIEEQMKSVLSQTVPFDEIVICDDASTDDTIAIIQRVLCNSNYKGKVVIKQHQHNIGLAKNVKFCFSLCSMDIIVVCDQDDIFTKNRNKIILDTYYQNKDVVMTFSDATIFWEDCDYTDSLWHNLGLSYDIFDTNRKTNNTVFNT